MSTGDLYQALRNEISEGLEQKLLDRLIPMIQEKLYANIFDLKEAAAYLHISESTLRRMVVAGEVPYFRQRGQYFFRQIDLDQQIDRQVKENLKQA